jgi:hypothetical protein
MSTESEKRPPMYSDVVVIVDNANERTIWGNVRKLTRDDFIIGDWEFSYSDQITYARKTLTLRQELVDEMQSVGHSKSGAITCTDAVRNNDWTEEQQKNALTVKLIRKTKIKKAKTVEEQPKVAASIESAIAQHKKEVAADASSADQPRDFAAEAIERLNKSLSRNWENRRHDAVRRAGGHFARQPIDNPEAKSLLEEVTSLRTLIRDKNSKHEELAKAELHKKADEGMAGDPPEFIKMVHEQLDKERSDAHHHFL